MPPDPLPPLDPATVDPEPMTQFARWYDAAVGATDDRAAAMTVATATPDGRPSARVVLLRGFDARGLVFFTNYDSRKGGELAANPFAVAVLYWGPLDAQIRVEGDVERVSAEESDAYFAQRPRGHRIGAWASHQSAPVVDRATLEAQVQAAEERFAGDVPRPPHWGGYRIVPETVEFWRNRADRVHDRVEYTRRGASWRIRRLSP
jgi:pyridoxamine 5'-phosphate oxidase